MDVSISAFYAKEVNERDCRSDSFATDNHRCGSEAHLLCSKYIQQLPIPH